MSKIYKMSDRIPIRVGDVTAFVSPLSLDQKTEIQEFIAKGKVNSDYKMVTKGITLAVKYALKELNGLVDFENNQYKLTLENNMVSDTCIDEIFNMEIHTKLVMICTALITGIPNEFTDTNGNKIEGVEIISKNKEAAIPN